MISNFSPKQSEFFNESNAQINIATGSVRAGKSHVINLRFAKELHENVENRFPYLISGKSQRTCETNIIDPLKNLFGAALSYNRGLGHFHLFGKKVLVVGANDDRAETKIRGSTLAGALLDEITILPHNYFKMVRSRLSVDGAKLWGGTNPDSPLHWLKTDYIDKLEHDPLHLKHFRFQLDDNPILSETYKESIKKEYQGLWYKRFILGDWVLAEGAIYDFFDTDVHVVKKIPTYAKFYFLGIDYGTTNPFAAVLIGYNDEHKPALWVEKEYYWDSKAQGHQKTDADYFQDLQNEFYGYPIRTIFIDPSAKSFEVELRRNKWPVRQAKNDVLDGIRTISTLLSQGNLVLYQDCKNLIKEIEGYVWDEKAVKRGEDQPLKTRDHAVDALRYVIYTQFGRKDSLKESNPEDSKLKAYNQNPMSYQGFGPNDWGWQRY